MKWAHWVAIMIITTALFYVLYRSGVFMYGYR